MTLFERFNKYAWVGVLKELIRNGLFTVLSSGDSAVRVSAELTNLANTLGLYTPAQRLYTSWLFGADDVSVTRTVAAGVDDSLWTDMSLLSADHRQISIVNSSAADSLTFKVFLSRNGIGAADDKYELTGLAGTANSGAITPIILPASIGYDKFIMVEITPVTSTQTFKMYLNGRGG